jgi:hypothetical protein
MKFFIKPLELPGRLLIEPKHFGDNRGYFEETWNRRSFADAGRDGLAATSLRSGRMCSRKTDIARISRESLDKEQLLLLSAGTKHERCYMQARTCARNTA